MKLDIVLRTCSNSLLTPKDTQRVCGNNRDLLLRKCFNSLVRAIRTSSLQTFLTIVDDNSDARFLDFLKTTCTENHIQFELVNLDKRGYNNSALVQFQKASNCENLVYIVEDDYLHEEHALDYLVGAYLYLMRRYNTNIVISPHDCPLRYLEGHESLATLHYDGLRYWRTIDKTANTMLTHYSTIKDHWDVFETLSLNYPKLLEDDTINKLYQSQTNPNAPIKAFSPIPSVAYHLGYSQPTSIKTTHGSWNDLWNRIPEWELIQGWFYHSEFYDHMVKQLPEYSTIVEIGTWRGKSTCCLALLSKLYKKNHKIYAVDTFKGSDEQEHQKIIDSLNLSLLQEFESNLRMCGVNDIVKTIASTSVEASKEFVNQSVDFVMIDGSHKYEDVKDDIEHWLPKLKQGGVIAGDDYGGSFEGVKKAVDEKFGQKVRVFNSLWVYSNENAV